MSSVTEQVREVQQECHELRKSLQATEDRSKGIHHMLFPKDGVIIVFFSALQKALDQSTEKCCALEQVKCCLEERGREITTELSTMEKLNTELSLNVSHWWYIAFPDVYFVNLVMHSCMGAIHVILH